MNMREISPYAISISLGITIATWMYIIGEPIGKSIGGGLMLGAGIFLFSSFFSGPKYVYGEQTILFNAMLAQQKIRKIEELMEEPPHHKEILAQRVMAGVEGFPTKAKMLRMTKDELMAFAEGMGVDPSGTKEEIAERLNAWPVHGE